MFHGQACRFEPIETQNGMAEILISSNDTKNDPLDFV